MLADPCKNALLLPLQEWYPVPVERMIPVVVWIMYYISRQHWSTIPLQELFSIPVARMISHTPARIIYSVYTPLQELSTLNTPARIIYTVQCTYPPPKIIYTVYPCKNYLHCIPLQEWSTLYTPAWIIFTEYPCRIIYTVYPCKNAWSTP